MISRDPSRPFDARLEGRGLDAAGPAAVKPEPLEDETRTTATDDGAKAPDRLPGGVEGDAEPPTRPRDHHARNADGVEELKRMEENAEAGRE